MCIILHTTKKIGLPDEDTLKYIFESNPDGAGMAFVFHDEATGQLKIAHQKGLMKINQYLDAVKANFARLTHDDDYIIVHTRIATSGGVKPDKTHPFKTPGGHLLFHNGVCSSVTKDLPVNCSDTEYIANNFVDMTWLKEKDGFSRYMVINPDGTMSKIGDWVTDKDGRLWSNHGYTYAKYSSFGGYPYSDYGYDYGNGSVYGMKTKRINKAPSSHWGSQSSYLSLQEGALFEALKARNDYETASLKDHIDKTGLEYSRLSGKYYLRTHQVTVDWELSFTQQDYGVYVATSDKPIYGFLADEILYPVSLNQLKTGEPQKYDLYICSYQQFVRVLCEDHGVSVPNMLSPKGKKHGKKDIPVFFPGDTEPRFYINKKDKDTLIGILSIEFGYYQNKVSLYGGPIEVVVSHSKPVTGKNTKTKYKNGLIDIKTTNIVQKPQPPVTTTQKVYIHDASILQRFRTSIEDALEDENINQDIFNITSCRVDSATASGYVSLSIVDGNSPFRWKTFPFTLDEYDKPKTSETVPEIVLWIKSYLNAPTEWSNID